MSSKTDSRKESPKVVSCSDEFLRSQTVYVASKMHHAPRWRGLRERGLNIISSWIDVDETSNYDAKPDEVRERWAADCLDEATEADAFILYANGDVLMGALLEAGAALAAGVPVYCIGPLPHASKTMTSHPLWHDVSSLQEALVSCAGERSNT